MNAAALANAAVTASKIQDGAVGGAALADDAVSRMKIRAQAVTGPKVADAAVSDRKLADAAVTNPKLADGAVTATKLAPLTAGRASPGDRCADGDTGTVTAMCPDGTTVISGGGFASTFEM